MRTPSGVSTNAWSSRLLLPGSTVHARRLPLGDPLLDVVDDEADVVHHRTLGAAISFLGPEVQIDIDARGT